MRDLLPALDAWRAEGRAVGRAVVIRAFGSAPRREGAVLLVADDGRMVGSVSGGCVEGATAELVTEAIRRGRSRVIRYGITDREAWDVGLACGGTIDVLVEPFVRPEVEAAARQRGLAVITTLPSRLPPPDADRPAGAAAAAEAARRDGPQAWESPGTATVVDPDAAEPPLADPALAAAGQAVHGGLSRLLTSGSEAVFVEAFPRPPRLVVVGATEVARHLVRLAGATGYTTVVVDPRAAFATSERFPGVDELRVEWPEEAFAAIGLGPDDAVAVLSHDPKVDEPAIVDAFARGARYVGAVGSRRSQRERRDRLLGAGLTEADLGQLHGPIGLDLGGREPDETALSILAEIVAVRRGGTGRPLADGSGPITARA